MARLTLNAEKYCKVLINFCSPSSNVFCAEAVVAHYAQNDNDFHYIMDVMMENGDIKQIEPYDRIYSENWRKIILKFTKALLKALNFSEEEKDVFFDKFYSEIGKLG